MKPSEPGSPDEPTPKDPVEREPHSSDYLNDPVATEQAWQEIVSELLDLSTNQPNDETPTPSEPESDQSHLSFPQAPWVQGPAWGQPDRTAPESSFPAPQNERGPRDWDDSLDELETIDAFTEPNPQFVLSSDRTKNLGWFLVTFCALSLILSIVFIRPFHTGSALILCAGLLGGAALLIWRMPKHREDDGSGGAQV
ncbi:hypothetical protein [Timonella sp. A28]|uniref:hypothetical protein n=1 Tax=Timonella sp. A28 TaxID=3442640 RepID=UPI003EB90752